MIFVPLTTPPEGGAIPARWFVFQKHRLLVLEKNAEADVPRCVDLAEIGVSPLRTHYLGMLDGQHCCSAEVAEETPAPSGMNWHGLRSLFARLPEDLLYVAMRAFQIVEWERTHLFCGACGAPTESVPGERARKCPRCGLLGYPVISPCIMVVIRRGREILLARSPRFAPGMYSALAGFVEPGETLEQAAAREVREEVGLEISNLRYFGSQSWPFPHSLMVAFTADHAGGELMLDPDEIEAADWFSVERLPALPTPASIARKLIDAAAAAIYDNG